MTNKDAVPFSKIMTLLNEIYGNPDKVFSDSKIEFYFRTLEHLSIEQINDAVVHMGRSKTFRSFPTPAEIIEYALGKTEDRAELAFESLMGNLDYYKSYEFEDGTLCKCIDAFGGWDVVNEWLAAERKWNRIEFIKLYKVYEAQGPWPAKKYVGALEAHNGSKGYLDRIPETIKVPAVQMKSITGRKQQLQLVAQGR